MFQRNILSFLIKNFYRMKNFAFKLKFTQNHEMVRCLQIVYNPETFARQTYTCNNSNCKIKDLLWEHRAVLLPPAIHTLSLPYTLPCSSRVLRLNLDTPREQRGFRAHAHSIPSTGNDSSPCYNVADPLVSSLSLSSSPSPPIDSAQGTGVTPTYNGKSNVRMCEYVHKRQTGVDVHFAVSESYTEMRIVCAYKCRKNLMCKRTRIRVHTIDECRRRNGSIYVLVYVSITDT